MWQSPTVSQIVESARRLLTEDGCDDEDVERHLSTIEEADSPEAALLSLGRILMEEHDYTEAELQKRLIQVGLYPAPPRFVLAVEFTPEMIAEATVELILGDFNPDDIAEVVNKIADCLTVDEALRLTYWALGTYRIAFEEVEELFIQKGILIPST